MEPRFSRRLDWHRGENALAQAETAHRLGGDRSGNQTLLDLTESNPTAVGLVDAAFARALGEALASARAATYTPSPRGQPAARRAVSDSYAAAGTPIDPERLILTASSSESYSFLWKLLCDPGDTVLIPEPSYPLFEYLARLDGVSTMPYRLTRAAGGAGTGAWSLDLQSVAEAVGGCSTRIGAIVVVSPNNPTGSVLRADELAALDRLAAREGIALIADEVFADYIHGPEPSQVRCVAARPTEALCFSLGGLSKSCGLPQLKLGWIAVGGPPPLVETALRHLDLVADTYLSVGTPVQAALPRLLPLGASMRGSLTARVARNRDRLSQFLGRDSPVSVLPSDGGWLAILRVPATRTDEEWAVALLEQDGVLVHPGYFFDLRDGAFLVVSLLPLPEVFDEGVRRLTARVAARFGDTLT